MLSLLTVEFEIVPLSIVALSIVELLIVEFKIVEFEERPNRSIIYKDDTTWVNSGVAILNKKILRYIDQNNPSDLPKDIYRKIYRNETLSAVPLTGYRCAIDSQNRYLKALKDIEKGEEITFDYETTETELREPFKCDCHGRLIVGKNGLD